MADCLPVTTELSKEEYENLSSDEFGERFGNWKLKKLRSIKMTIEKYLQDKVDINEITESDKDFILREINRADSWNGKTILRDEKYKYLLFRILSIYYIDYLNNATIYRTDEDIYNDIDGYDNKDEIKDINKILVVLVDKNVLKVEKRNEENTQFYFDNYTFSDAVVNSLNGVN